MLLSKKIISYSLPIYPELPIPFCFIMKGQISFKVIVSKLQIHFSSCLQVLCMYTYNVYNAISFHPNLPSYAHTWNHRGSQSLALSCHLTHTHTHTALFISRGTMQAHTHTHTRCVDFQCLEQSNTEWQRGKETEQERESDWRGQTLPRGPSAPHRKQLNVSLHDLIFPLSWIESKLSARWETEMHCTNKNCVCELDKSGNTSVGDGYAGL